MEDPDTDALRKLAPCWTLAGDERLLNILQNTHQRLVAKCQEANCQLEQMATALDDASITLQNVNNQFMALSSSQFIESRVYDDDADVVTETQAPKESPKPSAPDELSILKRSIAVIENTHEVITILHDSDTESESDDDLPDRLVMKPKDLYADRPLPYIIGSEPWKNKWHAGLLPEDTDSDSSTSKVDRESDQYSLSEPEDSDPVQSTKIQGSMPVPQHIRKVSDTSSELPSEATPTSKPTPSDVASELARRLGGGLPPKIESEPEYEEPARSTVRKIYKPQEPITSTIFPDEPPPLDGQSEEEADIFATLHRQQPYEVPFSSQYVSEQLFGDDQGDDIFSDFANQPVTKPTSLFDAGPKPHMFDRQPTTEPVGLPKTDDHLKSSDHPSKTLDQDQSRSRSDDQTIRTEVADDTQDIRGVKKPVGGISLFGSNKGTESIGAAILKRNRRKSSTSGEESGYDAPEPPPTVNEQAKKEKDIFDDLFAKSEAKKAKPKSNNIVKDIKQEIQKKNEEKVKKDTPKAVDLFSDNLFDDIDDIFTTNIVKNAKDNKKSIFEDDDDLFSEIAESKPVKQDSKKSNDVKKSLFDSDDDLFSENIAKNKPSISNTSESITKVSEQVTKLPETTKGTNPPEINKVTKPPEIPKVIKESTSIFDDDEDNIFSNMKTSKPNEVTKVQSATIITGDSNLAQTIETSNKKIFNSPSLFDDDDDDNDLFADPVKSSKPVQKNEIVDKMTEEIPNIVEKDNTDRKELKKDIDISITSPEIDSNITPKIPEENSNKEAVTKNVDTSSNSVKTYDDSNDIVDKKTDLVEEQINIKETKVDNKISHTENNESTTDNISEVIKENIDTNDINNIKTTAIQKMLDDNNDKTDDDFSEQDFDDEPLPESGPSQNNTNNTIEINKSVHNIFDNTALEEDIFASPSNIPDKPDLKKTENIESPEAKIDNKADISPTSDLFTDIVTEPPVFEKPKEPKKSKNVNALFDDDSDDETLFFKKEDVITDEKPDDFTVKQDRLFGIFVDEPPDVDFSKMDDDLDDDLFSTLPKPKIPTEKISNNVSVPEDLPIPEEIPKPNDTPIANSSIFDDIPTSSDADKNKTSIYTAEKQLLQEDSKISIIDTNKNTDDIFKLPTSEIKSAQSVKESSSIFDDDDKDDLFKEPVSLPSNIKNTQDRILDDDEELFTSLPVQLPQSKTNLIKSEETDYRSDEELFKSLPIIDKSIVKETAKPSISNKDIFKVPLQRSNSTNTDLKQEISDVKKVGKLKVGLNINVNALLPGASPKKVKPLDSPDGQTQSIVETLKENDAKLTKSVSFDGKPGSEILDNKLSKERPRIQVKRRPSTRKARREAVRKSGIDFGDDSTDNSSSIDDPPKPQTKLVKQVENISTGIDNKETINKNEEYTEPFKVESEVQVEKVDTQAKIETVRQPVKSDSTTKIVYILNDEDIFNTSAIETAENKNDLPTSLDKENNASSSTTKTSDTLEPNLGIKTLGNTYKPTKGDENKNTTKSIFGDENSDNDDELFKNKKPAAKASIFDSDSEGELFGNSKKVEKVKKVENVKVKGSLFGDDDDDDDLFGVKIKKKAESAPQPSRSMSSVKETTAVKSTQPVFEDPLSMFGDDD